MKPQITILVILVVMLTLAGIAYAASNDYAISWWTVDSGGGFSQGGDYTIQGTIGQPDAESSQGGDYTLVGGFWARITDWVKEFFIHLPLVMK